MFDLMLLGCAAIGFVTVLVGIAMVAGALASRSLLMLIDRGRRTKSR